MGLGRAVLGFTIVELMVSLTIGLVILAGMTALFAGASRSHRELSNAGQQMESGTYAIAALAEDLRHAGYYGGAYSIHGLAPAVLPDPCVTSNTALLTTALALPVQGYDAPASTPVACIPATDFVPGTDVIVVRRASTTTTALASLDANDVYIQSNNDWTSASNPIIGLGVAGNFPLLKKDGVTPADIRKFYVHIYYVSRCNLYAPGTFACTQAADGGSPVPTLKMLELGLDPAGGGLSMVNIPLAQGVENLQVDYGVDADGDGVADSYVTTPASTADWTNVTEIKLSLLVRNPNSTRGYTDAKTYALGLAGTVSPGGAYKRHLFTQHVRLINVAEMRELP
jgi:type IV pilus assembly protein PilW